MIKVEDMNSLQGAEKFGECISCGENKDLAKITFCNADNSQQHSIRLCSQCAYELTQKLVKEMKW